MEETTPKKRKAYATAQGQAEANKRWREKNKEKTKHMVNKGAARRFILNQMTLEEAEEFQNFINERIKQLKEAI